jgi:hypothetical protein
MNGIDKEGFSCLYPISVVWYGILRLERIKADGDSHSDCGALSGIVHGNVRSKSEQDGVRILVQEVMRRNFRLCTLGFRAGSSTYRILRTIYSTTVHTVDLLPVHDLQA